jgi:hypothetical protein
MDKLLTWFEKALYDETYYDADRKRIALEVENEELKNQISYLTERNEF